MQNKSMTLLMEMVQSTPGELCLSGYGSNREKKYHSAYVIIPFESCISVDSKHRTPNQIERNCIVEVLIDGGVLEMSKIMSEHHNELGQEFLSESTDFWTDPHCTELLGALVVDLIAEKYSVKDIVMELFMSCETAKSLGNTMVCNHFCFIKTVVHKHIYPSPGYCHLQKWIF